MDDYEGWYCRDSYDKPYTGYTGCGVGAGFFLGCGNGAGIEHGYLSFDGGGTSGYSGGGKGEPVEEYREDL